MNPKGKTKCFSFSTYTSLLYLEFTLTEYAKPKRSVREEYSFYYGMISKEDKIMITFIAILLTLLILAVFAAVLILVGSTGFIIVFGDVIVCGLIIWLIIRCIIKRRK